MLFHVSFEEVLPGCKTAISKYSKNMNLGLTGKNVVVMGASKGIGKSIALSLSAEGANLAICARGEEALRSVESDIKQQGVKVFASNCNVGNREALNEFLESAKRDLGSIDILVNNVSALRFGDEQIDWETSVNIDLMGSVWATQKVVPWMTEAGGGSILFISSISALEAGSPPSYAAMKAAIISYSKTMAVQLAPQNIRVNTIAPGSIEFEGGIWDMVKQHNRSMYDMALGSIPLGRMGRPDEVGDVAAFVVSPRASWITGACIPVDGGQHRSNL
jgi:3-oxoacyl-[acyl-carrier protein] reductase